MSALILVLLIFNIRNSRRFNLFDHWLHHKLVRRHDGFSWQIIAFINDPKLLVVWDIFLASFLINKQKDLAALWVLFTLGFTDLSGLLLKKWMHRKRPLMHSSLEDGYSFPSGHVLGTTIMVLIIWELFGTKFGNGLIITLAVIWIMVVISRISLKAHYPSDVIGATSLAVLCFTLSQHIFIFLL
ncbi:phosphatase PAP2 family protein [Lactobacillus panisapium]|uniref:phosphatase PAP2 family protein n=1 Tax=Lactobacillus panisapium TaxID=2012495 RepID=UPI0022E27A20|nr:phosphatase PAP2 family protein [Lactobacillus panisapium]